MNNLQDLENKNIRLILLNFIQQYPRPFGVMLILLLIQGCLSAVSILTLIPMADFLLDQTLTQASTITKTLLRVLTYFSLTSSFELFAAIFLFWNILNTIFDIWVYKSILSIKYSVTRGLFSETLEIFLKARWGFFSNNNQGVILNTLSKEINAISEALGQLAVLSAQIFQLFVYLAVPFWLNFNISLLTIILAVAFISPFVVLKKISYKLGERNTQTANTSLSILTEILTSVRLIISYGRQDLERNRFINAFNEHIKITLLQQTLNVGIPRVFYFLGVAAVLISVAVGIKDNTRVSELAAVMWSLMGVVPILSSLFHGNININNFIPSYQQLMRLRKDAISQHSSTGSIVLRNFTKYIEFINVCFSYPNRPNVLVDLNIIFKKGSVTALVGESGVGKSTISDLLIGLQRPNRGRVLIDQIDLEEIDKNQFRQLIGYVPQEPILFNSSLRDNLLWSFPNASEQDLWDALESANAKSFVLALPQGLETSVGDRGLRLSGGQRQRIALARALIKKPQILILDEATSSLDPESEKQIQDSIERLSENVTTILISHSLYTIQMADQIIVMANGRVEQVGTFQKLSSDKNGKFYKLLEAMPDRRG